MVDFRFGTHFSFALRQANMDKSIYSSELQCLRNQFKDFDSEIFDLCLTLLEAPNALIWKRLGEIY